MLAQQEESLGQHFRCVTRPQHMSFLQQNLKIVGWIMNIAGSHAPSTILLPVSVTATEQCMHVIGHTDTAHATHSDPNRWTHSIFSLFISALLELEGELIPPEIRYECCPEVDLINHNNYSCAVYLPYCSWAPRSPKSTQGTTCQSTTVWWHQFPATACSAAWLHATTSTRYCDYQYFFFQRQNCLTS